MRTLARRLNALDDGGQRHMRRELAKLTDVELKALILERLESEHPELHARYATAPEAEKETVYLQILRGGSLEAPPVVAAAPGPL